MMISSLFTLCRFRLSGDDHFADPLVVRVKDLGACEVDIAEERFVQSDVDLLAVETSGILQADLTECRGKRASIGDLVQLFVGNIGLTVPRVVGG